METNKECFLKLSFKKGYYIYYKHRDDGKLKYYLEIDKGDGFITKSKVQTQFIDRVLLMMDCELSTFSDLTSENIRKKLLVTGGFSYQENPLYKAAEKTNDEKLKILIKVYYNALTNDECKEASRILGYRILPTLEGNTKTYYVDANTIDMKVLDQSGYRILHTPYFAMMGKTHLVWRLEPSKKQGVDSAPIDVAQITFKDYLALFD